jgi:hypothetical protein
LLHADLLCWVHEDGMAAKASAVPQVRYATLEGSAEPATSSWTFT